MNNPLTIADTEVTGTVNEFLPPEPVLPLREAVQDGSETETIAPQPIAISSERLKKLAERHKPPQSWYESPEEDLFSLLESSLARPRSNH